MFKRYHYLSAEHNKNATCYVSYINNEIAGFISIIPQPCRIRNLYRIHRLVVLPDYQGIGVGKRMLNDIAEYYSELGKEVSIVTSAPSLLYSLNKNEKWICTNYGRQKSIDKLVQSTLSINRITASFRYKKN